MQKAVRLKLENSLDTNGAEALPKFLRTYGKAFSFIRGFFNHRAIDYRHKTVYIYPYTSITYWFSIIVNFDIDLEFNGDQEELFYDLSLNYQYSDVSYGVLLKNKNKVIGYYDLRYQRLILSDITHYDDPLYLKNAYIILKAITRFFNLKQLWQRKYIDVTVGCDPEFCLADQYGDIVCASDYIDDEYAEDDIGVDGSGDQLELRPEPGTPSQVINNLRELMQRVKDAGFGMRLTADFSLGGHIHFGLGGEVHPSRELLDALDDFIGKPTRHMCARYGYGALSSYESKNWGFEYRTPSAAIFLFPSIARIILKLAKNIVMKAIRNQVIRYNNPPILEDYVKLGLTKNEAQKLLDFYKTKNYLGYNVIGYWLNNKRIYQRKTYPLTLEFEDRWSFYTKKNLLEWAKHMKLKRPITLVLYGLMESRGKVNTIRIPGYGVIQHEKSESSGGYAIGICYDLRQGANDYKIIKAIRKYLREKFKV